MTWSDRRDSWKLSEAEVFAVIWWGYQRGHTDAWGGGVPMTHLARELGASPSGIREHTRELVKQDVVVKVKGLSPDGVPRDSYLPARFSN